MPVTEKRFQTRMPYHVHDKLVHASELLGATLNQFSLLMYEIAISRNVSNTKITNS